MSGGFLQASVKPEGVTLDPRTKLFLVVTVAVFVLGGAGGERVACMHPVLCMFPTILFALSKQLKKAFIYLMIYASAYGLVVFALPVTEGVLHYVILTSAGLLTRFLPGIMTANYLISTTTVSQFSKAMKNMHVPEKIAIPVSVMFRFFPTVGAEAKSIHAAMRMRGIRFGETNPGKLIEYRMVPLMTCCVKIGEELSAAALTRGLGGEVKRTNICKIGFGVCDVICFAIGLIPYGLLVSGILIGGIR